MIDVWSDVKGVLVFLAGVFGLCALFYNAHRGGRK